MAVHRTIKLLPPMALLLCVAAVAEAAPGSPTLQPSPAFRELARASGYIFIGTVTSVRESPRQPNSVPTVEVTFRVEKAFRGTRNGQSLKINQWSALWNSGQRYRVGERVLVFLYPRSKLGLTSIVGEPAGRIRAYSAREFILSPMQERAWFGSSTTSGSAERRLSNRQLSNAVLRASPERE